MDFKHFFIFFLIIYQDVNFQIFTHFGGFFTKKIIKSQSVLKVSIIGNLFLLKA